MTIVWPAGLPQDLMEQGLSAPLPENVTRKTMEVGPPKLRRRDTSAPWPVSGSVVLTYSQYDIFVTFFNTTTAGGSLPFYWKHPLTQAAAECTFKKAPTPTPQDGIIKLALELEMKI